MTHPQRLAKLAASLAASGLDAIALNPGPSLTYLTGLDFHPRERPIVLLIAPGKDPVLVLPELEKPKLELLAYPAQVFAYGENPAEWDGVFRNAVEILNLDGKRIGMEPRVMRLLEFRQVKAGAPEAEYPDASDIISALRICKDADEIVKIRRAVRIAQDALEAIIPQIKIGMTENELTAELIIQLLRRGSEPENHFSPSIQSGPNSANPHASSTDRKLQAGDLLVIDWGAAYAGYISDLTRTFAIGEVDTEYRQIHNILQEANAAGRAAGKPGVPCADVDKAARAVIEKTGYGACFTHRTGHGIGREVHEEPYMRGDNMRLLEPGMAYTVEPGIYLPGRNGARIEDDMIVTANGSESLSDMPRELRKFG